MHKKSRDANTTTYIFEQIEIYSLTILFIAEPFSVATFTK